MTVRAYIARDPASGEERGFGHPFERFAALQVAKLLWRAHAASATHYAVIVNVAMPPMDVVILSSHGLGIAKLEGYAYAIGGRDDTEWSFLDAQGKPMALIPRGGEHLNPFDQVRTYRRRVYGSLRSFAEGHRDELPDWLIDGRYDIQGTVMFTTQRFDLSRIVIDPAEGWPWFSLQWLADTVAWAEKLDFGEDRQTRQDSRAYRLDETHIDFLARDFFKTSPWVEIDAALTAAEPYGYLWMVLESKELWPVALDRDEMSIGRLPGSAIMLDSDAFPHVSRDHARLRYVNGEVLLTDIGSKHGTWVNGVALTSAQGYPLRHGDRIVLGACEDGGVAAKGSCTLVYRAARGGTGALP